MTTPWIYYCNAQNRACLKQENELYLKAAMRSSLSSWHTSAMAGEQLGEAKHCVHFIRFQQAWRLLRCFSTRVGSYPGSPGMCSSQTQQLGRHSSSQSSSRRCWPQMLKTQLHLTYTEETVLQQVHDIPLLSVSALPLQNLKIIPSSGALKPMKVWKCFDGHMFQLLFTSSAGVRRDLSSKGLLYECLLLSASWFPFHLAQVLYFLAEGLNTLPLFFL